MEVESKNIDDVIDDMTSLCEELEDNCQWGLAAHARKISSKLSGFNNSNEWRIYSPNYQSRACIL